MRRTFCAVGALALVIGGCGGGGGDKKTSTVPPGKPNDAAKQAAQQYLDAYVSRSPRAVCAMLTDVVQQQLADDRGTCVKTIAYSMKGVKYKKLEVITANADGDTAYANLRGTRRQITLSKESGAWKVANGGL